MKVVFFVHLSLFVFVVGSCSPTASNSKPERSEKDTDISLSKGSAIVKSESLESREKLALRVEEKPEILSQRNDSNAQLGKDLSDLSETNNRSLKSMEEVIRVIREGEEMTQLFTEVNKLLDKLEQLAIEEKANTDNKKLGEVFRKIVSETLERLDEMEKRRK